MYRGCISVGHIEMRGSSFIGEAVDIAGENFEACEGSFVFLTAEAADVFINRHRFLKLGHPPYFVPYGVPMKDGSTLKTITINPLLLLEVGRKREAVATYIGALEQGLNSESQSIRNKSANTIKYLEYLKSWQW